jgi:DNA-binding protein HU-beta
MDRGRGSGGTSAGCDARSAASLMVERGYSHFFRALPVIAPLSALQRGADAFCCPTGALSPSDFQYTPTKKSRGSKGMNKQELIATVADTAGLGKGDASKAVEAVFDAVTAALKKGDEVRLVGFGTFSVSKRKASTGRNPRTGEPMTIKASSQPKFKAGKGLKDAVN